MAMNDVAACPYNKYEAEDDLRTLTRAKEIQGDPKRMTNVRRAAKEKLAEMKSYEDYAKGAK